jgi:hypothetical protein
MRLTTEKKMFTPMSNFREADWENFETKVKEEQNALGPPVEITDVPQAQESFNKVDKTIGRFIEQYVSETNPCPHSKGWWLNLQLTERRRMVKKLARSLMRVKGITGNSDHARCKTTRNIYAEQLRVIKTKHWAEWLAGLDEDSVWTANKLGMGRSRNGEAVSVPTLLVRDAVSRDVTKLARHSEFKANLFYPPFFPPKPAVSLEPQYFRYATRRRRGSMNQTLISRLTGGYAK